MQLLLRSKFLLVAMLLLASASARAEYGCKDGFIPVTQGNGQNCVADYNLPYWDSQSSQSNDVAPRPVFAERWGAVAIDDKASDGGFGAVSGLQSKRKAEKEALSKCREGGAGGCSVKLSYYNQCATVAWGDTGYNVARAATTEEAGQIALNECGKKHANCKIFYGACSLSERVQ